MRRLLASLILAVLVLLPLTIQFANFVSASPTAPRQRVEQTEREVRELERVLKALEASISQRMARMTAIERDLRSTEARLAGVTRGLAASQARMKVATQSFALRVRSAYMTGGSSYLEALLNADSFGDLIVRLAYLRHILTRDSEIILSVQQEQERGRAMANELTAEQNRLRGLIDQRDAEYRNLLDQRREQTRVLAAARTRLAADLALITPRAERRAVYAVVLDNIAQARPQHGLAQATTIYEYEVEGRITRYLALFATLPTRVGPIRSARSHSAMLALENGAHFIYSSGGVDVLDLLRGLNVRGTDALRTSNPAFFRDRARRAPHNLFVNLATLGLVEQSSEVTIRPAYLSAQGTAANELLIEYTPTHRIRYVYVPASGAYRRHINDAVHRDAAGTVIMARNIIVQHVPHSTDLMGRPTPNLVGEGTIGFHALGQHFAGTWKKENAASPTRFFFADGREIERIYGQTWVQIVRAR